MSGVLHIDMCVLHTLRGGTWTVQHLVERRLPALDLE